MSLFKEWLSSGRVVPLFSIGRAVHPAVLEMVGVSAQYQGFWLDQEHASISTEQIQLASIMARSYGMSCFVRMPPVDYWLVTQALEAGAEGVMAAQIHTVEQAEQFVSWCHFPPRGTRGLNTSGRDADYSRIPVGRFVEQANPFVAIQVETLGAVEYAEQIAALDGVDLLFVGPADLSLALGVVGQFGHEKLWEAIDRVAAACKKHGKAWGAVVPTPEFAHRALDNGCQMPTVGNEGVAMKLGLDVLKEKFTSVFTQS